jgi:hypothetical protein
VLGRGCGFAWQLDITGSVFLADGTELKLISGIDDHSRFCVIATVVRRGLSSPLPGILSPCTDHSQERSLRSRRWRDGAPRHP